MDGGITITEKDVGNIDPVQKNDDVDYVNGREYGFLNCKKKQDHFQATLHSILGASFP